MVRPTDNNEYYELTSPVDLPKASGFLWNETMMVQTTCRGYAVSQFMQPEPGKYSHAPNLEAVTFMQPEQPYYANHPGRFVYVKDEGSGAVFSAPYEPVRAHADHFSFRVGKHDLVWQTENGGIDVEMRLTLPVDEPLEMWSVTVKNASARSRAVSVYPYFTVGYMSWMNQSGEYHPELQGIVCSSISPYQKVQDYPRIKTLRDKTFLLADEEPCAWDVSEEAFEGEGGLLMPDGVRSESLSNSDSIYEMPACVLQYRLRLAPGEQKTFRFLFGPARTEAGIADIRRRYFLEEGFGPAAEEYARYIAQGQGCLEIQTPDEGLNNFVNHWMARQVYYHGKTNRLSTDPQTRNYLQDNMGMSYIRPSVTRGAFLHALSQQNESGAMPDGILLAEGAQLKYINQVPHTDHCLWLPVCLSTYLDETDDYAILDETVPFAGGARTATVFEHINRAMRWLIGDRDERGLNFIRQGDWCDPMNMVGYKGKGVSGWLTIATAYAFKIWADISENSGRPEVAAEFRQEAEKTNETANRWLWDGDWYARGITDDGVVFGIKDDREGRIFINPQGWSLLSGAADAEKRQKLMKAVREQLETPYGVEKLAPSYTAMREDVGRVTQKFPGTAENGAVYNHASVFYIYALYSIGEKEDAYRLLRKMLPGPDEGDLRRRGQLPVFIPNYYRGAFRQFPRTAGRSSHLFNTGTISWFYRSVVDGLFGLQGCREGLRIRPQLPAEWRQASARRTFRGAEVIVAITREAGVRQTEVYADGLPVPDGILRGLQPGQTVRVTVKLPL